MLYQASDDAVARAKKVTVLLFDVDGVLTDGTIWLVPKADSGQTDAHKEHLESKAGKVGYGTHSASMAETKGFHAHDGMGISLARIGGLKCGFITKRIAETVATRARDLKIEHLYMGQAHKLHAIHDIMKKTGAELEHIAFVGDDIVDLPVMRVCGLAIATANARHIVKKSAHWTTPLPGGQGAARDAIEFILEAQGKLDYAIAEFLDEHSPAAAAADIGVGNM